MCLADRTVLQKDCPEGEQFDAEEAVRIIHLFRYKSDIIEFFVFYFTPISILVFFRLLCSDRNVFVLMQSVSQVNCCKHVHR